MGLQAATLPLERAERLPTSALPEAALIRGYSRVGGPDAVSRPCACGAVIVAITGADVDVVLAVADHVATPGHRAWALAWLGR